MTLKDQAYEAIVDYSMTPASSAEIAAVQSDRDRLFQTISGKERFDKAGLRSQFSHLTDQQFGLALWSALQQAREVLSIEFIIKPSEPGLYVRANNKQKLNRAQQYRSTAYRKLHRSAKVLSAVDTTQMSLAEQERLRLAQDKTVTAVVRAKHAMAERPAAPTVCDVPEIPRRAR